MENSSRIREYGKTIAEQDMFGHTIQLNFDKQGDSQKTAIGGVFSILIRLAMTLYVGLNLKKMFWLENNENNTTADLQKIEELGIVKYNETNFMFF